MPSQSRILSQPGQGMPQDMPVDNPPGVPGDMHQDNPPGVPGNMHQDNPPGVPGDMHQDNPPGVPGDMHQDIQQDNPPGVPEGMQQDNPPGVPGDMHQDIQQDNPPGVPGDMHQDMHQDNQPGVPEGMQQDNPPGVPGDVHQDIQQDNPPGVPGDVHEDIQQDNPPGVPEGMQQDNPPGVPGDIQQDNPPGVPGNMHQDNPPGVPGDMHQDNPPGVPGDMHQDIQQDNPPGVPEGMQQDNPPGVPGDMHQDIQQDNPPGVPGDMHQDMHQDNQPGVPEGMQQDNPPGVPGDVHQDIQQDNPPGVPGDVHEDIQQDNPPGVPEGMQQDNPPGVPGDIQQDNQPGVPGSMHQDMPQVLSVPVQETAEKGIGLRGEEVVYVREEQNGQTVLEAETVIPPRDEMQEGTQSGGGTRPVAHSGDGTLAGAQPEGGTRAGAQSRGGARPVAQSGDGTLAGAQPEGRTRAGAQSGGGAQAGAHSGGGARAQTNAGAVARVKTQGRTTVWAQAQYPTQADSTPQHGVQDWALPQEGAEAGAQLQDGDWKLFIDSFLRWLLPPGVAIVNLSEDPNIQRIRELCIRHRNVKLMTNYFSVNFVRSTPLYQYHVEYNPPCESKRVRTALLYVHQELIGDVHAFDGTMLFLPRHLPNEVTEVHSTRQYDGVQIRLTITLTSELPPDAPQAVQVFNIILRRLLRQLGMDQVQRHHYDFGSSVDINSNQRSILQVIPGVAASILPFEDRVLLNVDLTHKVIRTDTCLDVINREYMTQTNMDDVRRALIGCTVITRYNNRTYRVDDVNDSLTPTDTFRLTNGTTITFQEYFQQQYQITIVDQAQPLLMSRPTGRDRRRGQTGPIYLVPELCFITGLSDEMRADFSVMKDVRVNTRIQPKDRVDRLLSFRNRLERNQQTRHELENWGFGFSERLLEVPGHVFVKENITGFDNAYIHYNPKCANWLHGMKHQKLLVTVALRNWLMLFPKKHDQLALHFVLFLEISGRDIGMQISHPTKIALDDDRNETYLRALRNSVTSDIQMVVCIVSDKKKDRYNAIKRFCTCERPVPCQVVIQKNLAVARLMMKMTRNIAIQLNCKLGGEAWTVHIPFVVPVMVIGIDTYPDMSMRNWSVCGVVCSMNTICTRFYSRVIFYESHDELINRLMPICREGLRKYQQRRGVLPENIFIYRDGVREGQLDAVVSRELPRVKEIFQLYRENYSPHLSFIVVNKQVNTRLFIRTTDVENPPPGTVVDSVITKQECHNFFMVSDSRGTLSPTHYTVIFHNSGLLREYLQRFTFKLTHLYYNMPRTIRVPAPCQYAHKLASLVGQSLHREPSIHLADRLYYL